MVKFREIFVLFGLYPKNTRDGSRVKTIQNRGRGCNIVAFMPNFLAFCVEFPSYHDNFPTYLCRVFCHSVSTLVAMSCRLCRTLCHTLS
jgi:hypothetical protein